MWLRSAHAVILAFLGFVIVGFAQGQSNDLHVVSLNLHAYHPMGESPRYFQNRKMAISPADSYLFYFLLDEVKRGHERQLDALGEKCSALNPSVILLQEVVAGTPDSPKNCAEFYDSKRADAFGKNTALRLLKRLKDRGLDYDIALACRGNIGWQTNPSTFKNERIVRYDMTGRPEVAFDFGTNPYPNGMVVEGTAILVLAPWRIAEEREVRLRIPQTTEEFFFQFVTLKQGRDPRWILVANLHAGHKLRHFEQAVYVREALENFISTHPNRAEFAGLIVGGDLNAQIYRPSRARGEISTIPWEISVPGEFDYGVGTADAAFEALKARLGFFNLDSNYKDWATLPAGNETSRRISEAVDRFKALSRRVGINYLRESVDRAERDGSCRVPQTPVDLESTCFKSERIDHLLVSPHIDVKRASILFSKNDWYKLDGVSDHPAVEFEANVFNASAP